jgi:hypothetical protein
MGENRGDLPLDKKFPKWELGCCHVSLRSTGPFGFAQGRLTRPSLDKGSSPRFLAIRPLGMTILYGLWEFQGYEFGWSLGGVDDEVGVVTEEPFGFASLKVNECGDGLAFDVEAKTEVAYGD